MFGLTALQLLGLSVVAALVTTAGSLFALVLKEYFFARSFERWKERRTLLSVYRKYRDPIILAGEELVNRVDHICDTYPTNYLRSDLVGKQPAFLKANSDDDPYFQKYRLVSTTYRLCAFLGWLELYRQDVTFLDTGRRRANRSLEKALNRVRSDLADGHLNEAEDWFKWRDRLIFREEQRAIGDGMITSGAGSRLVMGYREFSILFKEAAAMDSLWWLRVARNFLLDLETSWDFRRERLRRMREDLDTTTVLLRNNSFW
jgi:hypothetical protein